MSSKASKIIYTYTDEAPALATCSLLPIVERFAGAAGIEVETRDISLAGRILAAFPDALEEAQRQPDALAELGELAKTPAANIIKLPNISASIPQLTAAIAELQSHGYAVPDFPAEPTTDEERDIRNRYGKVLGSAVNPVLREGNSDRRVAAPVKKYAQQHPHSMGEWVPDSRTRVAHMTEGDFFGSEKSHICLADGTLRIVLETRDGESTVLRDDVPVTAAEVVDAAVMNCQALRRFLGGALEEARQQDVLYSVHLKATMMKVSDPIIFGHAVGVYFSDMFRDFGDLLESVGVNPNNGLGDLLARIEQLPDEDSERIQTAIETALSSGPRMAMVDSDRGITNLHVPSDVIIDASMPAAIRAGGKMWGPDGRLDDMLAIIPDRSYAGVYSEVIDFCKQHGAFDVPTMGNVSNVGLMARKAEEYGSHDKTFEIPADGIVRVLDQTGTEIFSHDVECGDIWRMCQTKDVAIQDWIRLGVERARVTGAAAVFWLDADRAHDANLIGRVNECLNEHDTEGLEIHVLAPREATRMTCERCRDGLDTVSVTGNVLRDYLTDLFPILELGTSAKMLSIVPLLAGGGLFETGAGGSAPKHVQQFLEEGHLRWDSLGEFLALAVSLEDLGRKTGNPRAMILSDTLNEAISQYLDQDRSPSRKVGELDNRGSHFYLAMYWAQALATQTDDSDLQRGFVSLASALVENESVIIDELNSVQGSTVDIGGYYHPDPAMASASMRPSQHLNAALAEA